SVEVIKDPALAGLPVIVGGTSARGVVTSASYEARRTGVTSAMPTSRARRLCPDGIYLPPDFDAYGRYSRRVREVFDAFSPVVELWGVGERTAELLERLGLRTIGDVAAVPVATLQRALGTMGGQLARLAAGDDSRPVVADPPRKSVGAEETFERDLVTDDEIAQAILRLSDRVSSRLRSAGISGQTVNVKVRFANFVH